MNRSFLFLQFLLAMAVGSMWLAGCQNAGGGTEVPSGGSGPVTATGVVQVSEVLRIPDSGVWRTDNASRTEAGNGRVVCAAKTATTYDCSQSFGLKSPLGSDQLVQDLYALGVCFATVTYTQIESSSLLVWKTAVLNPLEDNLVRAFNASYKQSHPAGPVPISTDLLLYYANRLLSGDTAMVKKALPKGLVADSVKKALVLAASMRNLPAKTLESKELFQLAEPAIRAWMLVLAKEGKIADTTTLYPLPAVRVTEQVKVATDLVEGEGGVAVSGAFAWNSKGTVRKVDIKVKSPAGLEDSVVVNYAKMPDFQSGSWVLTGNVTLQAKRGARLGVDTLVAYVVGDSGADTSRTTFHVLAGDRAPPTLAIVQPEDGADVPNSTTKVKVVVEAVDAKGIAEVKIGNVVLAKSPYAAEVDLAVGFNFVHVQAKDNSGNLAFDTVVVRRLKSTTNVDTTDPVVTLKSPRADTTTSIGQSGFEFAWTATDDVGVQKVTLNDVEIAGEAGSYKTTVSLRDGANVFEIKAFDAAGNLDKQSATITRPADLSKPGIVTPLDRTVGVQDSLVQLAWKVTNSKKAVKAILNGLEVPADSQIVRTVSLVPGPNLFTLLVTDAAGAIYTGSVIITRAVEVILPSITPLADRNVGVADTSAILTWTITNSAKATAGTVNGQPVVVGQIVSQTVSVAPGSNRFVLLLQDATGKTVTDTVFVIRAADATGPVLTWVAPAAKALSVESSVSSYTVQVKANDASGIDSVWIRGVGAKKEGDVWSQTVALPKADGIPVVVQVRARDIHGNTTNDSVAITRAQGDIAPPVITLISPKGDTSFGSGKTEILIEAKAADAGSGVKSFTIAGLDVMGTGVLTFGLKPGKNTVVLIATDSAGNSDTVKLTVTSVDDVHPVITLISPTGDQVLGSAFQEMIIIAKAEDVGTGVKSFTIQGVDVSSTGEITVGLKQGKNPIPLIATDSAGNSDTLILNLDVVEFAPPPVITPAGGEFPTSQTVYIESSISGASIYYTMDGSTPIPGAGAIKYDKPFLVKGKEIIIALLVADGYQSSISGAATFLIAPLAAEPIFSPEAGSLSTAPLKVTMKTSTPNAAIYYTTNGSSPSVTRGTQYTGAVDVSVTTNLSAVTIAEGYLNSPVVSQTYIIAP